MSYDEFQKTVHEATPEAGFNTARTFEMAAQALSFLPTPEWTGLNSQLIQLTHEHYFCGYTVAELLGAEAFLAIRTVAGGGFCYELAALAMLMLKNWPGAAKLVQGLVTLPNGDAGSHAVVQLDYYGTPYIWDLSTAPFAVTADDYARMGIMQAAWAKDSAQFWEMPETAELYEAIRHPETSNIFWELGFFRPDATGRKIALFYGTSPDEYYSYSILNIPELGRHFYPVHTMNGVDITEELVGRIMATTNINILARVHSQQSAR